MNTEHVYASLVRRATATTIDAVVALAFMAVVVLLLVDTVVVQGVAGYVLPIALFLGYFAVPEWLTGATVGKFCLGIRVRDEDGSRVGGGQALIRNAFRFIDGQIMYLVGAAFILRSERNQRLGDRYARTVVVRRSVPTGDPGDHTDLDG